ncbi:hypothetical protein [Demequina sediminicola]|uniref:hypothetical protein n=1 Tax=Demequina sediminicola TaxID=1095026 RepID=UPI000784A171|nr:hypothetical protein [Demequina sediminicola]
MTALRIITGLAAAVAVSTTLSACSTSSGDEASPTPTVTLPAVTMTPTEPATASDIAPDAPLTEPGATVEAGGDVVLPLTATNDAGEATELKVQGHLEDVTAVTLDDFAPYIEPTDLEGFTGWYYPAYVHATLTMVGEPVPEGYAVTDTPAMTGVTDRGGQASEPVMTSLPDDCPAFDTDALVETGTATGCWVMMVNDGAELVALEYRGNFHGTAANYTANPVTWEIGIAE